MHLSNDVGFQSPGIYGTCFAIQLLAMSDVGKDPSVATEIAGGFQFLQHEYEAAMTVIEQPSGRKKSRQRDKKKALGHTDFDLTLKNASILDASNALCQLRTLNSSYAKLIHDHAAMFDAIAKSLINGLKSVLLEDGSELKGWSWTLAENKEMPQLIPTCYALSSLTHPSQQSTVRYCDNAAEIANSIYAMMLQSKIVSHKALALNTLQRFSERCDRYVMPVLDEGTKKEILEASTNIEENPRQETLHFDEQLSDRQSLIHKPWIWIFPQLEIAWAALSLSRKIPDELHEYSAKLVENARMNHGSVVFMRSAGSDVLANLRTAEFLTEFSNRISKLRFGAIQFQIVRFRLCWTKLVERYSYVMLPVVTFLLLQAFLQNGVIQFPALDNSATLALETLRKIADVWPVWIVIGGLIAIFTKGTWKDRIWKAVCSLFVSAFLQIALNLV